MTRLPHPRYVLFLVVAIGTALVAGRFMNAERAMILGFDSGAIAFLLSSLRLWYAEPNDGALRNGSGEDGGRALLLAATMIVLAAILLALARLVNDRDNLSATDFLWVAGTLVLAWLFVNVVYAFHYAHSYYERVGEGYVGGLNFPGDDAPVFADFCYFALIIGMTCQVSDVVIETRAMRRTATLHGLLTFFFNLGVLAMTINVLSGVL